MAGASFSSPPRVTPSRPKLRFTLAHANKALAYVGRIVKDIVSCHRDATNLQAVIEAGDSPKQRRELEQKLEKLLERLQVLVDELSNAGVELKDFQMGLVDFIGRHQGRDVYLCWKLGEASITHWHELDAGFAGRQPVSLLDETL